MHDQERLLAVMVDLGLVGPWTVAHCIRGRKSSAASAGAVTEVTARPAPTRVRASAANRVSGVVMPPECHRRAGRSVREVTHAR